MKIRSAAPALFVAISLASLSNTGCGSASSATPESEPVARSDEALYGMGAIARSWPNGIVPVCFADMTSNANWRTMIPPILARTWSSAAGVRFIGFGACDVAGSDQVTVTFAPQTWGNTSRFGASATTVQLVSDDTSANFAHFQYEVIHEMGHALGFAHEQERPDNWVNGKPLQCPIPAGQTDFGDYSAIPNGINLTPTYDVASIMNYCDPQGNLTTNLSAGDISGARMAYPFLSPTLPMVMSISPSSGPNVGGTVITIKGFQFNTQGKTQVTLGSYAATNVSCTATQCTATVPQIALQDTALSLDVRVTVGTETSIVVPKDLFTYTPGPSCSFKLDCTGHAFGFPSSVDTCTENVTFFNLFQTSSQVLVATNAATHTYDTNDVGSFGAACDSTGSCSWVNTYEASSTFCGAVPPKEPPPANCSGLKHPGSKCTAGWTCCGDDGWSCGVCN